MRLFTPSVAVLLVPMALAVVSEGAAPLNQKTAADAPQRRLRMLSACAGSTYEDYAECQRAGFNTGGLEIEKEYFDGNKAAYVDLLHDDAEKFIMALRSWLREVTSDWELGVDTTFSLTARGPVDLQRPCGSLLLRRAFGVLEKFIENPVDARLSEGSVRAVFWRPSTECFDQYGSVDVDGGAHASLQLTCGSRVLLNASIAMGGSSSKSFWRRSESSGVVVSVSFWDRSVRVVRAAGILKGTVAEISDTSRFDRRQWGRDIRACKDSRRLAMRGVVGGAWSQRHTGLASYTGSFKPSIVGYADTFELASSDSTGNGAAWDPSNMTFPPWLPSDPNAAGNPSYPMFPPVNWTSPDPWNTSTSGPWTINNTNNTPWPSNNQSNAWFPWFPNTTAPSGNWTTWNPWNMSSFNASGAPWSPSYPNGTWFPWNTNVTAPGSAGNWTWNPWNSSFLVPYLNGSYAPWPMNDTNGTWYRWYLNSTSLSVELPSARDAKRLQDWSEAVAGSYFQSGVDCSMQHSGVSCFLTAALSQLDQRSGSSQFAHAASPVGVMGVVVAAVGVVAIVGIAVARRRHTSSQYARLTPDE